MTEENQTENVNKPDAQAPAAAPVAEVQQTGAAEPELLLDEPLAESLDGEQKISNEPDIDAIQQERAKANAFQDFPIGLEGTATVSESLNLPSTLDSRIDKAILDTPNVALADSDESRHWMGVVADGTGYNTMEEVFVDALDDPEAEFRQNNSVNGVSLNSAVPKFRAQTGQNLKGERAMIRMITHLDLGTVFQVMLWHSGISVTFKPPVEEELIELYRQLMADKIKFGRNSYGLAYSSSTVYSLERLFNFALDHIYDITTKSEDINISNIRKHIRTQDVQLFLWGFICTMYPKGFPYERGCVADPDKCHHVIKENLNVHKLQYTNMKALSDWQKTFMSGRQSKQKTLAEVQRYQEESLKLQKRRIILNEGQPNELAITLRSPMVDEYIEAGHQWVDSIVDNVEKALGEDATVVDRNTNISLRGSATVMRQYAHWVDSIELDGNVIDDREAVNNNLNVLTSNDIIRNWFLVEVIKFINHSTVSIIGIPSFDCPKCGKTNPGSENFPAHVNIIPLDVIQVFFGLISQRIQKIAIR